MSPAKLAKPTTKLSLESFGIPVKVIVGWDKKELYIQRGIICARSDFFKGACKEHWESGQSNTITLEEDDPIIFSLFLTWLLTGDIQNAEGCIQIRGETDLETEDSFKQHFTQLLQCYVLGDTLGAEEFRNYIMDKVVVSTQNHKASFMFVVCTESEISYIFANTSTNSPLRRMIIDSFIKFGPSRLGIHNYELPGIGEFLCRLSEETIDTMRHDSPRKAPWEQGSCYYHEHRGYPETFSCTNNMNNNLKAKLLKY